MTNDSQAAHGIPIHALDSTSDNKSRVDAIILPTVRGPAYLLGAADLAIRLGCPLVTLHSGKWSNARHAVQRLPEEANLIAIDVHQPRILGPEKLETSQLLAGTIFDRTTDISAKRNVGLVLSGMLGWGNIIFLEDDILIESDDSLRHGIDLLSAHNAVRFPVEGYPHNSVIEHAHRVAGGTTNESITCGGALLVSGRYQSFFPDIYNDDWFYLLDPKRGLTPTAVAGEAAQGKYDPFRSTLRARAEQLGDVLAEGIFCYLNQGFTLADSEHSYWRTFLKERDKSLVRTFEIVSNSNIDPWEKERVIRAVKAARGRLTYITPDLCLSYLRGWVRDWHQWQDYLYYLEFEKSLESALNWLAKVGAIHEATPPTRRSPRARNKRVRSMSGTSPNERVLI